MRTFFTFLFILTTIQVHSQDRTNNISGIVSSYGSPMSNVNIAIKGSTEGIQSDTSGKYEIDAKPRDVLVFSYIGMNTIEIIVEDVTSVLNIEMIPKVEELDEVTVLQKEKKGQEALAMNYTTKKSIISTGYGFIDAEKSGSSMTYIEGADLNLGAIDIVSALIGKIPGLRRNGEDSVILRGGSINNNKPPIFEIDGVIFTETPSFLALETIDRIAVIPGLKGAVKYGNIAAGGIIIINTKTRSYGKKEEGTDKPYDQVKLRDNTFDERSVQGTFKREPPKYILEIEKATTVEEAMSNYDAQKKLYGSSPYFYLAVADFFKENWGASGKEAIVINELMNKHGDNSNVLKALAYSAEEKGDLESALKFYIEIFKKRPRYAQSYRDLAYMYAKTKKYKKALGLYARYQKSRALDTVTTAFEGIDAMMDVESTNLLARRGKELGIEANANESTLYQGIRVVFEWNNSEAEFDLQFVNPEKTYFIWSHTNEKEKDRIMEEKTKGYSSEQFLIDESKPGQWMINLKYHGNKSYEPTMLKTTTYYNYGLSTQRSEVNVFRLELKNVNQKLFTLQNR